MLPYKSLEQHVCHLCHLNYLHAELEKKTLLLQSDQLQVSNLSQCNVCVEICMNNYLNGKHYTSSIC